MSDAMTWTAGYTLHLYCDKQNENHILQKMAEYGGENRTQAFGAARRAGWVIHKNTETATCPDCAKPTGGNES